MKVLKQRMVAPLAARHSNVMFGKLKVVGGTIYTSMYVSHG
jgi:hypothetical protein